MNKQTLNSLQKLNASPEMMQMAALDVPAHEKYSGWERCIYKHSMYLRCCVEKGVLKVAIFLPEPMRTGGQEPVYELYISREEKTFLTYDRIHSKWFTGKLDMLCWPSYVYYSGCKWISQTDSEAIKTYLDSSDESYDALLQFQRKIRRDALIERHKKETDPWDADLSTTPKLPKDWMRWVSKVGIEDNYIFYHYNKKGTKSGYCTFCEKEVPIEKPHHNGTGCCPRCGHTVVFKSVGKAGTVSTKQYFMHLIQRCKGGFMVREFQGSRIYIKNNYQMPECVCDEVRRVIYETGGKNPRAYYLGLYRQCETRWIRTEPCCASWSGYTQGRVYRKTLPSLNRGALCRTGLYEMIKTNKVLDPEKYLAVLSIVPQLEQIVKAALPRLADECMSQCTSFSRKLNTANGSLTRMLGINTAELKRLRANNGGQAFLKWLQYESTSGSVIPDQTITWFCDEKIDIEDLTFICDRMSMLQIFNYLRRQMSENKMCSKEVLTTWHDYLSMAKRLGMDTNDEIVFRVRKLRERHDELVKQCQGNKSAAIQAGEIVTKFPHLDEICHSLKKKYEYADMDYTILAPTCIEDIILEGKNLSHCVASSERYWERMEKHETYLLFLRRTAEVEKPYYTLEIEPDGTVRQKRTKFDRQEADIEDAKRFLSQWQQVIAERISDYDRKLAEQSRILRAQEYAQLRSDQVIIKTGDLAGQLLVDVLLADLMETAA